MAAGVHRDVPENHDAPEHLDVLIVGAGLSGIGAAARLQTRVPGLTYAIVEARDAIGGTWDLFRYPGVRSDSDMYTLGYPFRPWTDPQAIADGPAILAYIRDTAAEYGITGRIRFGQKVTAAAWSSETARWTVTIERAASATTMTCGFLYMCSGYYSYGTGHVVDFPGQDRFAGRIVHPQQWPDGLDYAGQRIVVIGSGATAVTLVPAMAEDAEHVTMVQRSPGYIAALPGRDALAGTLRRLLPERAAYRISRGKNIFVGVVVYQLCQRFPARMGAFFRNTAARQLPADVPVDPHFTPRYPPWEQRLCVAPDADFYRALASGKASVVTGEIAEFTEKGVRVIRSVGAPEQPIGEEIPADLIVTATGLKLVALGGARLTVDGDPVDLPTRLVYKGHMLSGVPNLAWCVGYTNASWTLRADLTSRYVCRLLKHMRKLGYAIATPHVAPGDLSLAGARPVLDLSSGYVQRAAPFLPKQGIRQPWRVRQNYILDLIYMRFSRVAGRAMRLTRTS